MPVREVGARLGYRTLGEASKAAQRLRERANMPKPKLGRVDAVTYVPVFRALLRRWFIEEHS